MYKRYCKSCGNYDVDLYPYDKKNYLYNPMMCRCCIISEISRLRELISVSKKDEIQINSNHFTCDICKTPMVRKTGGYEVNKYECKECRRFVFI